MEKTTSPNPNSQPMGSFPSSPSSQPEPAKPETPPAGSDQRSDDPKPSEEQQTETLTAESEPPSEDRKPAMEGEEEEEEAECGFCLFMKGGGCKDEFIAWEKCVEEAEKSGDDIADKCFDITHKLRVCMDAHADYYEPILRAEKSMAESLSEVEPEGSDSGAEVNGSSANVQSEKDAVPVSAP